MTRWAKPVLFALVAVALGCVAPKPASAQVAISSRPIQAQPIYTKGSKPVREKFRVMHMLPEAIQVRSVKNAADVHNFTYSDAIRPRMQQLLSKGGYQYGDKVTIDYVPDKQVALKITGKPSKPATP